MFSPQNEVKEMSVFSITARRKPSSWQPLGDCYNIVYCITTMHFEFIQLRFERVSLAQTCIIFSTHRTVRSFNRGLNIKMTELGVMRFPRGDSIARKGNEV